jgi:two-component system, OmpR family, sensor kinase
VSPGARPVPGEPLDVAPPASAAGSPTASAQDATPRTGATSRAGASGAQDRAGGSIPGDPAEAAAAASRPRDAGEPGTAGEPAPSGASGDPAPSGPGSAATPEARPAGVFAKLMATLRRKRPLSLRARLVGMLLILLIVGFSVIGGVTHASMAARLSAQVNDDLRSAVARGQQQLMDANTEPSTLPSWQRNDQTGRNLPQNGTIVGAVFNGAFLAQPSYRDPQSTDAGYVEVSAADQAILLHFATASEGNESASLATVNLSIGTFRFQAVPATVQVRSSTGALGSVETTMIVGVPTAEATRTLATLDVSMVLVSLGGIILIGTLGTVLVSRALRPLARVSAVASAVAEQPLEKGNVDVDVRVAPEDAVPGTEVGNVGAALNSLLDNVDGALDVRARSEARMRRFAADASHELRTPLAAIQGYSELIGATEALSDDGDRSLGRVREQTRRMTELVENLLLLARLDEGRPPAEEPVDLTRLAVDLSRDFTVAAKDHRWKLEFDAEHPVVVTGDEPQLNRVLQNLMSNARKHTSDGTTVTVGVRATPDGQALLTVTDNGEGIDPEFLDKVFDRFARADAARSGAAPTTGLGLSIVKAIVESHGGHISVESEPGRTQFAVRLPLAQSAG